MTQVLQHPPLLGLETEYAVTFFGRGGRVLDREIYSGRVVRTLGARTVSLRGRDDFDLFLPNGGRLYRDAGVGLCNIEYATAECTSPAELIAHAQAGDSIVAGAVRDLVASRSEVEGAVVSKCNLDYHGHTSGSHENHLHTQKPPYLARQLIPLLVSRVFITGGGGFDDASPGSDFMCSPRVRHLEHVASRGAQHDRAIFTIKDESLAGPGYQRLQLLCSEGVRCEVSERLRFATVALALRVVEAGATPGKAVRLVDPLAAINAFARDPSGAARAVLSDGRELTAVELQHHYLDEIEAHLGAPYMPVWSEAACEDWRSVLNALAENPDALIGQLDWPTKRHLYRAHCRRRGLDWESLPSWGSALRTLMSDRTLSASGDMFFEGTPRLAHLLKLRGPSRERAERVLGDHGLRLEDLQRFIVLRDELFELDIRFGELGPDSLFAGLEREGIIAPGAVGQESVERAMTEPPAGSRAETRASWVRRLHPERATHVCHWDGIRNLRTRDHLDLREPFGTDPTIAFTPATQRATSPSEGDLRRLRLSADDELEIAL
jgi:proteasome accessory factor A